ncbi:hypothetical protein Atai01_15370 [Amycolatopsis taiwanensis]|uniref:Uncharacterized protein n=2 Tax=Amycolatopsis taiwanensis TaxID=342230 RepID=A0A9W6QYJ8_9PSEU|nr:hypothetical protein Atai01_15370 [Amycolatopsis taiwanensis]
MLDESAQLALVEGTDAVLQHTNRELVEVGQGESVLGHGASFPSAVAPSWVALREERVVRAQDGYAAGALDLTTVATRFRAWEISRGGPLGTFPHRLNG